MVAIKRIRRAFLALIFILCLAVAFPAGIAFADGDDEFYLGGFPAGFILNTQNVEVIGLCEIDTEDGAKCPARDSGIMPGDTIKQINGINITSVSKLTATLSEDFSVYKFDIERGDQQFKTELLPVKDKKNGKKHFGMLVRDSLNGIGTVTYINKSNLTFGSLGHPVADSNGKLIGINGGTMYGCSIYDVKKGLRGNPGELKGIFDNGVMMGLITNNTTCGIFGKISSDYDFSSLKKIKKGDISQVEMGKAYIYSTLSGKTSEQYEISIIKIEENNKENKNFIIKINDKRLLEKAGGIVQGMSGSPIVQNGKLIGAVTHVFINDPTRGYGISIDNMINS
ncbi:MAG: SpoIVB peptidase S55 domain-containing protein [Candidatus Coproplasma sp.]